MIKKIIIGIVIVGAIAGLIIFNLSKSDSGTAFGKGKVYEVEAEVLEAETIQETVNVNGIVKEKEETLLYFTSPLKINELYVKAGDEVKAGDPLMTIDTTDIEEELAKLKVNREIEALQLQKLKTASNRTNDATYLAAIDLENANVTSAKEILAEEKAVYEKKLILYNEELITQEELDAYKRKVDAAERSVKSAELGVKRANNELSSYYTSNSDSKKSTNADIAIQLKSIELVDMNIKIAEDEIAKVRTMENATGNGVINEMNLVEGGLTPTGRVSISILNNKNLKINANIKQFDANKIKTGQKVVITGDAIEDDMSVMGEVDFVEGMAKEKVINGKESIVIPIEIDITKGEQYLKIGYEGECEIITNEKSDIPVVTFDMLRDDDKVYIIGEDHIVEERVVELGLKSDFNVEITSGVEIGETVIVNPSNLIKDGVEVKIKDTEEEGE